MTAISNVLQVASEPFDIDGWHYLPSFIFKNVDSFVQREESIGVFTRFLNEPNEDYDGEDESHYIGITNHAIDCSRWLFRQLTHAHFRAFCAALEASSIPLASGHVRPREGYSGIFVRGARTTITLQWAVLPENWVGIKILCDVLYSLRKDYF